MYKYFIIIMFCAVSQANASNGSGNESLVLSQCQKLVEREVEKGAQAFTIRMIERMAKQLFMQKKVPTLHEANQCIVAHLITLKIPFEQ